ncbi:MAG: hypothetical protein K6B68_18340 [Eubacterium sp.]|nr:hypothetical protein [Eubacterium sp.]
MNKAYLEMLAQFIEECDLNPDIYIEKMDEESLKAAQDYIKGHKGIFDPVKASGSMTIASDLFIAMLGHTVE